MATLEIVQIGHPALRQLAREVSVSEILIPETQRLVDDMVETMRAAPGVGLAAPQVAQDIRLFVAEAHPSARRPNIADMDLLAIFNPRITVLDDAWDNDWEGCLSIGQGAMWGIVKRFRQVRIDGLGRDGQPISRELEGFHARVVQHEFDHLDGVLFFDRIYERLIPGEEAVIATLDNYNRFFMPPRQEGESENHVTDSNMPQNQEATFARGEPTHTTN